MDLMMLEDKELTAKDCDNFLVIIDKALSRHATVVETMAAVSSAIFWSSNSLFLGCHGNERKARRRSRY